MLSSSIDPKRHIGIENVGICEFLLQFYDNVWFSMVHVRLLQISSVLAKQCRDTLVFLLFSLLPQQPNSERVWFVIEDCRNSKRPRMHLAHANGNRSEGKLPTGSDTSRAVQHFLPIPIPLGTGGTGGPNRTAPLRIVAAWAVDEVYAAVASHNLLSDHQI